MFDKLADLKVSDGSVTRTIAVYHGDLAAIPAKHAVDLLVISAFPGDYIPTPSSVIGALYGIGISVGQLSKDKEHDLRTTCSFWLSKHLPDHRDHHIRQIACFEVKRGVRQPPTAFVGDLFRGLFPFVSSENCIVAMPLLAAGDQKHPPEASFDAITSAASHWMSRGLGIRELKIVIRERPLAETLAKRLKRAPRPAPIETSSAHSAYDVFLSFSSRDADAAQVAKTALEKRDDLGPVFDFRFAIDKGVSWQAKIDEAITSCRSVVAVISPDYIASPECREELFQARLRHKREGGSVLFPIYWRKWEGDLALWLQLINAADCREADLTKLPHTIASLNLAAR